MEGSAAEGVKAWGMAGEAEGEEGAQDGVKWGQVVEEGKACGVRMAGADGGEEEGVQHGVEWGGAGVEAGRRSRHCCLQGMSPHPYLHHLLLLYLVLHGASGTGGGAWGCEGHHLCVCVCVVFRHMQRRLDFQIDWYVELECSCKIPVCSFFATTAF